jgi:ABC-type branched-subunit amino acid transport system substrate-binding protein
MTQRILRSFLFSLTIFGLVAGGIYFDRHACWADERQLISDGQKIYRDGILPSGQSINGYINGDVHAPGHAFACVSCHMRSGLGSLEGTVLTTPVSGSLLYRSRRTASGPRTGMRMGNTRFAPPSQPTPPRPAYTDTTLADVIRGGVDSSGRVIDQIMPRYNFTDHDMAALISYLKSLSAGYSPGVDASTVRFATVISDDVPPGLYLQHLSILDEFIKKTNERNSSADLVTNTRVKRQLAVNGRVGQRRLVLTRWFLKGAPNTWRRQLEEYNRTAPVFAMLGGMSASSWQPVHDFCEANQLPCLFPQTDLPVISDTDWYTLYLSRGYYQEGETAARFLADDAKQMSQNLIVVYRQSPAGSALLDGFMSAWKALGKTAPQIVTLLPGEALSAPHLSELIGERKSVTCVIWDGSEVITLLNQLSSVKSISTVIASAHYVGPGFTGIHEASRCKLFFTYPARLPQEEQPRVAYFFGAVGGTSEVSDVVKRTYPLTRLLSQVLTEIKDNFYSDYVLDLIAMNRDMEIPLYERLSFGPGQRYASKGCYVVQLGAGAKPELIRRSDWVLH